MCCVVKLLTGCEPASLAHLDAAVRAKRRSPSRERETEEEREREGGDGSGCSPGWNGENLQLRVRRSHGVKTRRRGAARFLPFTVGHGAGKRTGATRGTARHGTDLPCPAVFMGGRGREARVCVACVCVCACVGRGVMGC